MKYLKTHFFLMTICTLFFWLSGCGTKKEVSLEEATLQDASLHEDTAVVVERVTDGESMIISSSAFACGDTIPATYTCDGKNISPALVWQNAPSNATSFVLICEDPDAPHGTFVHWVLFNIPASITSLPEGAGGSGTYGVPGSTSFKTNTYGGPCPPSGTHRYFFKLYALDTMLDLQTGSSKKQVLDAMHSHIIAQSELMGTYQRSK